MNSFKEFDYIHTPDEWLDLKPKRRQHHFIKLTLAICFMICSSIGFVYAYYDHFMNWIYSHFQENEIITIAPITFEGQWYMEHYFLWSTYEDNHQEKVDKVFVFKDGQYVEKQLQHMTIKDESLSFDYIIEENNILAFDDNNQINFHHVYNNGLIYYEAIDHNIYSLDMNTKIMTNLTNDGISMNSIMSPKGRYILMNKNDQYWTCYDTEKQTERKVPGINSYAHSNTIDFLDENHVMTYNDFDNTCIIDLETMKQTDYDQQGHYPLVSTFVINVTNNDVTITDLLTGQTNEIELKVKQYHYYTYGNRYILFQDNDTQNIIIYDFQKNQTKQLDYNHDIEEISCEFIDNQYLIIMDSKSYCIISLEEVFS